MVRDGRHTREGAETWARATPRRAGYRDRAPPRHIRPLPPVPSPADALAPSRPSPDEVTGATRYRLARGGRLEHPVLVRHLLWTAVDLGLPLHLRTGSGDSGIRVHPTRPTDWLHLTAGTIPVLLLHCRPHQRQAACPAAVSERVRLDVGLPLHHVDPARAGAILAEALEITPFRTSLYSSDAYGVAEFPHLGAPAFRHGPAGLLQERVDADEPALPDAPRLARWAGRGGTTRAGSTGCPAAPTTRPTTAERRGDGHSPGAAPRKHETLKV